jgi:hypothetical protein
MTARVLTIDSWSKVFRSFRNVGLINNLIKFAREGLHTRVVQSVRHLPVNHTVAGRGSRRRVYLRQVEEDADRVADETDGERRFCHALELIDSRLGHQVSVANLFGRRPQSWGSGRPDGQRIGHGGRLERRPVGASNLSGTLPCNRMMWCARVLTLMR